MPFTKATKQNINLRMAIQGPSGCGKTYTALNLAQCFGEKIALIDSEAGSSHRYSHLFNFDSEQVVTGHPNEYIKFISEAASAGYPVLIIDSLSHAWFAELDIVGGNFSNWSKVRPLERALLSKIIHYPGHIITTMRSKTEWSLDEGRNKAGNKTTVPTRVGTAAVQSPGIEYEFDVVLELDLNHLATVSKTRLHSLDGRRFDLPGRELADAILADLREGGDPIPRLSRQRLIEQIGELTNHLGWSTEEAKSFLVSHFRKHSRKELSDGELAECLSSLQQIQEEGSPAPQQEAPQPEGDEFN